jgi:hypothetical protein
MKFLDILFCDDVRIEVNNKVSAMGLYHDRIIFYSNIEKKLEWPVKIDLAILIRLIISDKEKKSMSFMFECFSNDKSILKIEGNANLSNLDGSVFCLILNAKNIELHPGDFGYLIKVYDEKNEYLTQMNKKALKIFSE